MDFNPSIEFREEDNKEPLEFDKFADVAADLGDFSLLLDICSVFADTRLFPAELLSKLAGTCGSEEVGVTSAEVVAFEKKSSDRGESSRWCVRGISSCISSSGDGSSQGLCREL